MQDLLVTSVSKAISSVLETLNFTENKCEVMPPSITDIVTNSRATFPVGFGHAACYVNHRVALVGYVKLITFFIFIIICKFELEKFYFLEMPLIEYIR